MIGKGIGCLKEFVKELRDLQLAMENMTVVQKEYLNRPATMKIRNGQWVLEV